MIYFSKMGFKRESIWENGLISIIFFLAGISLNIIGYSSFQPILVGLVFFISSLLLLIICKVSGKYELQAFIITFSICWFWAGVASIYANYFNDIGQKVLDAAHFYELAAGNSNIDFNLFDIGSSIESAATIIIWRTFYDAFDFIGFSRGPYIGISVNICFVAFTSVIGVRMVKNIFGNDNIRINKFIISFWLCPIFWYFASVHIRDAAVLFSVSLLALIWIVFLQNSSKKNSVKLILYTILSFLVFGLLRTEFIFVPFAMILAGIFAILIGRSSKRFKIVTAAIIVTSLFFISHFSYLQEDLVKKMEYGNESYNALTLEEISDSSLGNQLIVSAALPIRLLLGSAYLFVFPIPFWTGFQLVSVSLLFKSIHVLFMYGITPLFILAFWQIIRNKFLRTVPILFLLFLSIGFTLAVAYTSLETRHFSSFLLPVLIVSIQPNLDEKQNALMYFKLLKWFLGIIITIHFTWILIKFI